SVVSDEKKFATLREGETGVDQPTVQLTESEQLTEEVGFFNTITHPKVLGMMLVLLIAFFTIANLAEK
ncbi:MAG: hypothetical protein AABY13_04580, partial [Nanoarchaeota archaeon]